jgi:hypothetical protein
MINRRILSTAIAGTIAIVSLPKDSHAQTMVMPNPCLANVACTATVVTVAGITYWLVVWRNGSEELQPYYSEESEHLPDPEGTGYDWTDYVWADSLAEAQRKCREYAQQVGTIYAETIQVGRHRYECRFRYYES